MHFLTKSEPVVAVGPRFSSNLHLAEWHIVVPGLCSLRLLAKDIFPQLFSECACTKNILEKQVLRKSRLEIEGVEPRLCWLTSWLPRMTLI